MPGKILHALIGYQARPAGIQVLVYLGVLFGVLMITRLVKPAKPSIPARSHRQANIGPAAG